MTDKDIFQAAVIRWGIDSQVDMAFEEMAELTHVLCKVKRLGYEKYSAESEEALLLMAHLEEEVADVELMLAQIKHMFGLKEVEEWKQKKLARLCGLLGIEYSLPFKRGAK